MEGFPLEKLLAEAERCECDEDNEERRKPKKLARDFGEARALENDSANDA